MFLWTATYCYNFFSPSNCTKKQCRFISLMGFILFPITECIYAYCEQHQNSLCWNTIRTEIFLKCRDWFSLTLEWCFFPLVHSKSLQVLIIISVAFHTDLLGFSDFQAEILKFWIQILYLTHSSKRYLVVYLARHTNTMRLRSGSQSCYKLVGELKVEFKTVLFLFHFHFHLNPQKKIIWGDKDERRNNSRWPPKSYPSL